MVCVITTTKTIQSPEYVYVYRLTKDQVCTVYNIFVRSVRGTFPLSAAKFALYQYLNKNIKDIIWLTCHSVYFTYNTVYLRSNAILIIT